jgi:hypothetical protein
MGGVGGSIKINIIGLGYDNTKELSKLLLLIPLELIGLE